VDYLEDTVKHKREKQERCAMTEEPIHHPDAELVLRVVPMPADANANGDIFGGWVMAQVDIAGSVPAVRLAKGRVATVAVNSFHFKQPVSVGDLLSFWARVVKVGVSSVTVHVEVSAERHPEDPILVKVTDAILTYVAIDRLGQKRPLPVPLQ
jgi:acyl-CoA thioesterase YciA